MYYVPCIKPLKPPIPCITSSRCKRLRVVRPVEILLTYVGEEDTYITSSRCKRLRVLRPVEIYFERLLTQAPPCNVLKYVFLLHTHVCIYVCMYVCMFVCIYIRMYTYVCMYIRMYDTYVCVCMYVYTRIFVYT